MSTDGVSPRRQDHVMCMQSRSGVQIAWVALSGLSRFTMRGAKCGKAVAYLIAILLSCVAESSSAAPKYTLEVSAEFTIVAGIDELGLSGESVTFLFRTYSDGVAYCEDAASCIEYQGYATVTASFGDIEADTWDATLRPHKDELCDQCLQYLLVGTVGDRHFAFEINHDFGFRAELTGVDISGSHVFLRNSTGEDLAEYVLSDAAISATQEELAERMVKPEYQIAAGDGFACALDDDGVSCWGGNIGQPPLLENPYLLAAGFNSACAADDSGVVCWGADDYGQVSGVPSELAGSRVVQLEINGPVHDEVGISDRAHACAMTATQVYCWGDDLYGQSSVPPDVQAPSLISLGFEYSCVVDSVGLRCWGAQGYGLEHPTTLANPRWLSAGHHHLCTLDDSGLQCWGDRRVLDLLPTDMSSVLEVGSGQDLLCARYASEVRCWAPFEILVPETSAPYMLDVQRTGLCALDFAEGTSIAVCSGVPLAGSLSFTDTDRDGISDEKEIDLGLDPQDPSDALKDLDADGLSNLEEARDSLLDHQD